jgi:hypothetical protein
VRLALALPLAALLAAGTAAAQSRPGAEDDSLAQQCYQQRKLQAPKPDFCRGIDFLEAEGKVLEVDLKSHHLRLEHFAIIGGTGAGQHNYYPAGPHDYYVEPAYLLAAVAVGDSVRFAIETGQGHVVDVYPLLDKR